MGVAENFEQPAWVILQQFMLGKIVEANAKLTVTAKRNKDNDVVKFYPPPSTKLAELKVKLKEVKPLPKEVIVSMALKNTHAEYDVAVYIDNTPVINEETGKLEDTKWQSNSEGTSYFSNVWCNKNMTPKYRIEFDDTDWIVESLDVQNIRVKIDTPWLAESLLGYYVDGALFSSYAIGEDYLSEFQNTFFLAAGNRLRIHHNEISGLCVIEPISEYVAPNVPYYIDSNKNYLPGKIFYKTLSDRTVREYDQPFYALNDLVIAWQEYPDGASYYAITYADLRVRLPIEIYYTIGLSIDIEATNFRDARIEEIVKYTVGVGRTSGDDGEYDIIYMQPWIVELEYNDVSWPPTKYERTACKISNIRVDGILMPIDGETMGPNNKLVNTYVSRVQPGTRTLTFDLEYIANGFKDNAIYENLPTENIDSTLWYQLTLDLDRAIAEPYKYVYKTLVHASAQIVVTA